MKDARGQKELISINELIQQLSHQYDLKVTYLNGFHVNKALTDTHRFSLDFNFINPDFDGFFKASQPVIDEQCLNPPELNLISGIYLVDTIDMVTHKKSVSFMGSIIPRDYKCLDFSLTNLSRKLRNDLMSNLNSNEQTLQNYIKAKMRLDEKEYLSNPSVYSQITNEKKQFMKTQIKARQWRRIMMIIMSKQAIPSEVDKYKALL